MAGIPQVNVVKTNLTWFPLISASISVSSVLIWLRGGEEALTGKIELGTLVAFVTYTTMFYQPVQNLISNVIPFTQQSLTSMERIIEVLNARSEVREPERPREVEVSRGEGGNRVQGSNVRLRRRKAGS